MKIPTITLYLGTDRAVVNLDSPEEAALRARGYAPGPEMPPEQPEAKEGPNGGQDGAPPAQPPTEIRPRHRVSPKKGT